MLVAPPNVPRSTMRPGSGMKKARFAGAPATRLCPTACPGRLTASASLSFPPSVPRSTLVPSDRRYAWKSPKPVSPPPTMSPTSLMSLAEVLTPVRGFRSTIPNPAGLPRRAEPNRRLGAAVVVIDPGLQHVHRVLLTSLVRHIRPPVLGARRLTRVDGFGSKLVHDRVRLAALQELVARLP